MTIMHTELWESKSSHKTKCEVCEKATHKQYWEGQESPNIGVFIQCVECGCYGEDHIWKQPVYIWKDQGLYHSRGSYESICSFARKETSIMGMTTLVKQAGSSFYLVYSPPEGETGEPISDDEISEVRQWAGECLARDYGW